HKNDKKTVSFNDILGGHQIEDEVNLEVQLKPRADRKVIGKPVPRQDIYDMAAAAPVFVHNLRFPDMVHARVVRPPAYQANLKEADETALLQQFPKLLKVVRNGSFLGVISKDEYTSIRAQEFLKENTTWTVSEKLPDIKDGGLPEYLKSLPAKDETVVDKGNISKANADTSWIKASYFKPYIMHGAIGPSCAVGLYEADQLYIWTHSQGVYPLRETLSGMLNMPMENIHVKGVPGSGCYGHNGADDVTADVALLARAYPGKHVRLQWSRHDEHAWEPYGSAMILEPKARLSNSGKITHWEYDLWSDTHSTRPGGNPGRLLPAWYLDKPMTDNSDGYFGGASRNAEPYYRIPNQQVHTHFFHGPLRISALRGLGAYANIFAIESFMDELAEQAGKDPYDFRLMHLDDPRAKEVVEKLHKLTSTTSHPEGTGLGIAFSRYKNNAAYCAIAARVAVKDDNDIQLQKMWAVIDAGETINPDGLKNQTEGGMIQSASWTLKEEVTFNTQHITSRDWNSYPIFRFDEVPEVEVIIIDRPEAPPLGAGEAAQGPAAAAVANAVYHTCGKRVRRLPVNKYIKM
ncbi:molybdopterin cofactor-binding domain-containing protein, partial [Sinomicrobium weinanense]